jgi:crotonobetainyl-CoA:carnitine CoA-transferase CaiB-like acyl-CoA transferase
VAHLPMQGVKVLEVAQFTYTPAAGAVLADWGADVIKVEHAVTGDAQRGLRLGTGSAAEGTFSPIMEHPNRGKRSIGLALENPAAREVLYELARRSDVFLTNFLPDARRRLEIDVDDLRAVNSSIIYVRGSALGARGPEAHKGGYDKSIYWARAGSSAGATPAGLGGVIDMPAGAYGDSIGAMTIAGGVSAALFGRERTGEPAVVDVSLLSVGAWAMALSVNISLLVDEPVSPMPLGATAPHNPLVGYYETADQRWINLTMLQAGRYWADFCKRIEREDLIDDERFCTVERIAENTAAAAEIIAAVMKSRTHAEWVERFETMAGQWASVQNSLEIGHDPQLRANGYIAQVIDAEGNERELLANPVQFDETPATLTRAPQFAEHTDEILQELGLTDDEIIDLKIKEAVT